MFSAGNARVQSITSAVTETEIALLNINIIGAVQAGNVSVYLDRNSNTSFGGNVVVGSPMTTDSGFYNVWQLNTTDNKKSAQMNTVIDNFAKLGYTISRKSADGQYLYWQISW
jgi:hypothetical protein